MQDYVCVPVAASKNQSRTAGKLVGSARKLNTAPENGVVTKCGALCTKFTKQICLELTTGFVATSLRCNNLAYMHALQVA